MDIPEREIYRYLGYRGAEPGREVQALVEECTAQLRAAATPRSVNRRFPVRMDRGCVLIGPMEVRSAGLCKNLDRAGRLSFCGHAGRTPWIALSAGRASVQWPGRLCFRLLLPP